MNKFILLITLISPFAYSNEPVKSSFYWISHGYFQVKQRHLQKDPEPTWAAHSLSWPVPFQDAQHSIGNSMAEYQNYGSEGPYFHGGCDLRVKRAQSVTTPVAGKVEAGHYGYTNNADGSMTKFWTPWPQSGNSTYFEIGIITDDGYRFEFHHMNENQISDSVLKVLKSGGGRIEAGTVLGNTIPWPPFSGGGYHHTHYNIISPSGVRLNPEYYSSTIEDHLKPEVQTVLASIGGKISEFGNGIFTQAPDFFALAVQDHQDQNIYDHPPVFASIQFSNGDQFTWDFRQKLLGPDQKFPDLWTFFVDSIKSPSGDTYETSGGYGTGVSVVRVLVPKGAHGPFTLEVGDQNDNRTEFHGSINLQ